jgi:hypothetical protein
VAFFISSQKVLAEIERSMQNNNRAPTHDSRLTTHESGASSAMKNKINKSTTSFTIHSSPFTKKETDTAVPTRPFWWFYNDHHPGIRQSYETLEPAYTLSGYEG